jgi:trehalose 6-phosphate synthase
VTPRLVLASDRGPVTAVSVAGRRVLTRRSGSVTALLDSAARALDADVSWYAPSASADDDSADRERLSREFTRERGYVFEPVPVASDVYDRYYYDAGVRMLWLAHHDLWSEVPTQGTTAPGDAEFFAGYDAVNRMIAAAMATGQPADDAMVFFHDYQLSTGAWHLRGARPSVPIGHFLHTPFATPESLGRLPAAVVRHLLTAMLAADLLVFQRAAWARRFAACCEYFLGTPVDRSNGSVRYAGGTTWVRCHPVRIDARQVTAVAGASGTQEWISRLRDESGRLTIVRVDRLDPSKNILRGFAALDQLLTDGQISADEVRFLAFLVPSRPHVREFKAYAREVRAAVASVEARFPGVISLFLGEDLHRAMAALSSYDVLLVNALCDGMNLIGQEGPLLNRRNGALILSRGAGCSDVVRDGPIFLDDPLDVPETAAALLSALRLSPAERARRADRMRAGLHGTPAEWVRSHFADLAEIARHKQPATPPPDLTPRYGDSRRAAGTGP